jgi:hypothetical protein
MALTKINNNTLSAVTTLPAAIATGKVLQVVQGTTTTSVDHSTTFADTGLSASITPSSTSNKILVIINQHCYSGGGNGGSLKLFRDSTAIYTAPQNYAFYIDTANGHLRNYHCFNHLDSPSSTSALTYKTQAREYTSGSFQTQNDSFKSYITLMEVSA